MHENPKVIASVQRRFYSERFRNFVDLCVVRNLDFRPTASQLLEHNFIKKFKQSHNIQSIFQLSVMADGLIERQKKQASLKLNDSSSLSYYDTESTTNTSTRPPQPSVNWNFWWNVNQTRFEINDLDYENYLS